MNDTHEINQVAEPVFLIVEDHDNLRTSLCELIKIAFQECRILSAKDSDEAMVQALAWKPDIVLVDIALPAKDGIESTRRITTELPQTHVVALTIHDNPEYHADAMGAGASACITISKIGTELIPIITNLLSTGMSRSRNFIEG